jgi:hypothetical protein
MVWLDRFGQMFGEVQTGCDVFGLVFVCIPRRCMRCCQYTVNVVRVTYGMDIVVALLDAAVSLGVDVGC